MDDNVLKVPDFALLVVLSLHVDAKHYKFNSAVSGRMTRNNLLVFPTLHRGAGKNLLLVKLKGVVLGSRSVIPPCSYWSTCCIPNYVHVYLH